MAREEKGATEAVLESWREGIRWFFREGRAEMRREAEDGGSDGHRPTLQAERGIVLDVSVPSVEADSKGEGFEPKKPRGSAALPCGGWRAAMIRVLRIRKYAYRTEQSYLHWADRFARILARQGLAVEDSGDLEIRAFLDELAVQGEVSAGTQKQALNALVFLFREALERELGDFSDYKRAKAKSRLPVVLSREEIQRLLEAMEGRPALMARAMCGSGLRLSELLRLRVYFSPGGRPDNSPAVYCRVGSGRVRVPKERLNLDRRDSGSGSAVPSGLCNPTTNSHP